jgi:flagellar biosynthesis protein FliR
VSYFNDACRGLALVLLWLPIKMVRIFAAILVFSPVIAGITITNVIVALLAGLVSWRVLQFHRRLRGQPT